MNKTTRDNLSTAMNSEAFTYAKYKLFAERARRTGNTELAQLLETTAPKELFEHFAEEAALAEIVRSDVDNLEDAIASESYGSNPCIATLRSKLSPPATKRWRTF